MTITPYVPPASLSSLPSGIWSGVNSLAVLPYLPGQTPQVSKAPLWSTLVKRSASARERRTALWAYPLWQFEVQYEAIRHKATVAELATMWEFFNTAQGQYGPWLFVDPSDCQVLSTAQAPLINTVTGLATGDGATKIFQLTRKINSWAEPVYGVYGETVKDNAGAAGAYTIGANGLLTFTTAPTAGHAMTWYGYYYFLCRFLQDDLTFDQIVTLLWEGKSLKFTSIRP